MNVPRTIVQLFFDAVEHYSTKRAALRYRVNGAWRDVTHQELARRVRQSAFGLIELGIKPGDRVAILSGNRPEWAIVDYACILARAVDVPIYPTLPPRHVRHMLRDSGAKIAFVSDPEQFQKIREIRHELPDLQHVIGFSGATDDGDVLPFLRFIQIGAAAEPKYPTLVADGLAAQPDDVVTLIYTSGTTGDPKGVMLTHKNFCTNVVAALEVLPIGPDDTCLSLLPLCHSFERMGGHYTMFHGGCTINYAETMDTVARDMKETRPTIVLGVPRLYEKFYARVLDRAVSGGGLKRRIFFWSWKSGERWADTVLAGKPVPALLGISKRIAQSLVFNKMKAATGGRIRFFVSGSAPLSAEIARFFYAAGLPVLEGYGLTETSPVVTLNSLQAPRIGTVGPPIPGVEVRLAEDGEILVRGPNVMAGYFNQPEATREAIDGEGWFHTGDVGEFDEKGYLRITDRKKDLIKTSGGKFVAPQPIENLVKGSKFVLNAVVLGDKRKFPIILVVPNWDAIRSWADERRLTVSNLSSALGQPDVVAKIEREVMGRLRDLAHYEMPKKVLLVENDFTIEGGELTPTLKVKRKVVEERYKDLIDGAYEDSEGEGEKGKGKRET
ncbi:MAG: long-chain fatty acid--CoA ligase [Gemmatimonadetes bacterium]|nr:long-chain fatty acid--CoA ligase [Gemmatimonadota bacterium]